MRNEDFALQAHTSLGLTFDATIKKLTTAPILGFANPKLPYIRHTDASTLGLGAALYQEQQGQKQVVAYVSRGLSKCESRYPAYKLKSLALKWAMKHFYWPKMSDEEEAKIKTCTRCLRRKTMPEKATPLINIVATRPLELVCMGFLSVELDSMNTKDILVITDHFMKYAVAVLTLNQKTRTVAKTLWDHFFVHYGNP